MNPEPNLYRLHQYFRPGFNKKSFDTIHVIDNILTMPLRSQNEKNNGPVIEVVVSIDGAMVVS